MRGGDAGVRLARAAATLAVLGLAVSCGPSQAARSPMSTRQIVDTYKPAIVRIENDLGRGVGVGTGFIVRKDGRIATNLHVIAGGGKLSVRLANGATFPVHRIVAIDESRDLAIIEVQASDLPTIKLGDSSAVSAGDRVVAIGNPMTLDYTVSDGLISSVRPFPPRRDSSQSLPQGALEEQGVILQISAPISQGSSGGPLFNSYGEVIGVATAVSSEGQNLNFAMPINYLRPLLAYEGGESPEKFAERYPKPSPVGGAVTGIDRDIPEHDLSLLDSCSKETLIEVFQGVQTAIALGAPVYNRGDHEGCFVIYRQTALHFQNNESVCRGIRDAFKAGIERAEKEGDATAKAWAMRDTFDGLLEVIVRKAESMQGQFGPVQ